MPDTNSTALFIGFVFQTLFLSTLGLYIIPKQFEEYRRPKNQFTLLRFYLLALFMFSFVSTLPAFFYRICRFTGCSVGVALTLRNVATITSTLSSLAILIVLVLIYNYRDKEGK